MRRVAQAILWRLLGFRLLRLDPGDVLVMSWPTRLNAEQHHRIVSGVREIIPETRVLVLSDGLKIDGVIRRPRASELYETSGRLR